MACTRLGALASWPLGLPTISACLQSASLSWVHSFFALAGAQVGEILVGARHPCSAFRFLLSGRHLGKAEHLLSFLFLVQAPPGTASAAQGSSCIKLDKLDKLPASSSLPTRRVHFCQHRCRTHQPGAAGCFVWQIQSQSQSQVAD